MSKHDVLNILATAILFAIMIVCFASCKAYYPLPSNTITQQRDSVRTEYVHDSIYIERVRNIYTKGDTVYIHDSIFVANTSKEVKHDSIHIYHTDTIHKVYPPDNHPTSTRETTLSKGTVFLRNSGIALWVILSILFVAIIIGITLKFAK